MLVRCQWHLLQPTIHFFQNGKKASEMVGADVKQLNATMEELYKWVSAYMEVILPRNIQWFWLDFGLEFIFFKFNTICWETLRVLQWFDMQELFYIYIFYFGTFIVMFKHDHPVYVELKFLKVVEILFKHNICWPECAGNVFSFSWDVLSADYSFSF